MRGRLMLAPLSATFIMLFVGSCKTRDDSSRLRGHYENFSEAELIPYKGKVKIIPEFEDRQLIDTKKGGAGLGLFKMLYSSHSVVCNVDPGKTTEVIVLISLIHPVRDFVHLPRSIHYFNTSSH